jgi:hypothetical protein
MLPTETTTFPPPLPQAVIRIETLEQPQEFGFTQLQGEPRAIWEAERLRLMLWTGVVRWLARESAFGWSPDQVTLIRDAARKRINEQVDAMWWLNRRSLFVEPGSLLDGTIKKYQQPAPKYGRTASAKADPERNDSHPEDGTRAARLIMGTPAQDALNGVAVASGEPEHEDAGRWANAVLAELRNAPEPTTQEVPEQTESGKLGELVKTVQTKLGALRRRHWIPGPDHPWRSSYRHLPPGSDQ